MSTDAIRPATGHVARARQVSNPAVRYTLAVLATLAVEGSVIKWVTDHRKHHDFASGY